jgi:hypothetical protein
MHREITHQTTQAQCSSLAPVHEQGGAHKEDQSCTQKEKKNVETLSLMQGNTIPPPPPFFCVRSRKKTRAPRLSHTRKATHFFFKPKT